MKNIYEVVIKHPNGSKTTGSAAGAWMTSQDAINYVLNKMPKRRREGIIEGVESGEYEIEVNPDVNNDMNMNELAALVKATVLKWRFSDDHPRKQDQVIDRHVPESHCRN